MMRVSLKLWVVCFCTLHFCMHSVAHSQNNYPNKPIQIIIPYNPGGDSEKIAKSFVPLFEKHLNTKDTQVVFSPGDEGQIALTEFVNAPPNGYHIMMGTISNLVVRPAVDFSIKIDLSKYRVLAILDLTPIVCATSIQSGIASVKELIDAIQRDPNSIRYSSNGTGAMVIPIYFLRHSGLPLSYITSGSLKEFVTKSSFEAFEAVATGKADYMCMGLPSALPYIRQKKMRAIFSTSTRPLEELPDLPIPKRLRMTELEKIHSWRALIVPAKTPEPIVMKLKEAIRKVALDPQWETAAPIKNGVNSLKVVQNPDEFIKEQVQFYENIAVLLRLVK